MLKGKRINGRIIGAIAAGIVSTCVAGSALATVSATGSITGVPDGPSNYLYTITLNNTGTQNIDTFWFAWLPDNYDFLPSVPTPTGQPASWTNYVETGYYGSSIQFYDTGSNPILAGHSSSAFQFVSPDAPADVNGGGSLGLPVTYSYVYNAAPDAAGDDPLGASSVIFSMPVATPEPGATTLLGIGGAIRLLSGRRRKEVCQ